MSVYKTLFGTDTVDSILAAFNTQREALLAIAQRHGAKAAEKSTAAQVLLEEAASLEAERERALRVSERIANLVG